MADKTLLRFDQKLVLNRWVLHHFGVTRLEDVAKRLRDERFEGFTPENRTRFYEELNRELFEFSELGGSDFLTGERLLRYDANIVRHWKAITEKRNRLGHEILPAYFQYLSLLFTEIYLEYYFTRRDELISKLNGYVEGIENLPDYKEEELNKLAFWSATGSGKTLLMHVHLLQFKHYHSRYASPEDSVDNIILITPDERMTDQHLRELELSGIRAAVFSGTPDTLFKGSGIPELVEALDIHKLQEEEGVKTFAVESFEGNNLVFIDEGHRGFSSGKEGAFLKRRDALCSGGFSFEYSATFGQAVANNRSELEAAYAKNILFDYSYRYFYSDGYGKDFRILNMSDVTYDQLLQEYLVASLVSFYQQLRYYKDHRSELEPFLFEKPLWIFVGSSVIKTGKNDLADVAAILLFISRFIENKAGETENILGKLLNDTLGLHDKNQNSVFSGKFTYLTQLYTSNDAKGLFNDIKKELFHAADGSLHIERVTGSGDEVLLRLGAAEEPFGIITVGDPAGLCKHIDAVRELPDTEEREFSRNYFPRVDKKDSPVQILIGAKKFIEGWSSWRVASMGLMNIGKNQGPQIIQLFGRGVRLKGYDFRLKRSNRLEKLRINNITVPKYIDLLETLTIFGIRASYMEQFRDILEEEGVIDKDFETFELPVKQQHPERYNDLKVIEVDPAANFRRDGGEIVFDKLVYKNNTKVVVNWSTALQVMSSKEGSISVKAVLADNHFREEHIPFINIDKLHKELIDYKNERGFFNLTIKRNNLETLLMDRSLYTVQAEDDLFEFTSVNKIPLWNEIASSVLKKQMDQFYYAKQREYENSYLRYSRLKKDDAKVAKDNYAVYIPKGDNSSSIKERLTELTKLIEQGWRQSEAVFEHHTFKAIHFDRHLYYPLIHLPPDQHLTSSPVGLNKGEWQFVRNLERFYRENSSLFNGTEVFLLRNESRGRGVGFFLESGFFPDFIMWVFKTNKQHLVFIDPKGIQMLGGPTHPKLEFYKEIKTVENKLNDTKVTLDSFIISVTPYEEIRWNNNSEQPLSQPEFERRNVLFQRTVETGYFKKMFDKVL